MKEGVNVLTKDDIETVVIKGDAPDHTVESVIEAIESICSWAVLGAPRSFMELVFHKVWPEADRAQVEVVRIVYTTFKAQGDTESLALSYLLEKVAEQMLKDNLKYADVLGEQGVLFWRLAEKVQVNQWDTGVYEARTRLSWTPRTPEDSS